MYFNYLDFQYAEKIRTHYPTAHTNMEIGINYLKKIKSHRLHKMPKAIQLGFYKNENGDNITISCTVAKIRINTLALYELKNWEKDRAKQKKNENLT